MPDPQRDIAPIIEPATPPAPPVGPDYFLPIALSVGVLLLLAAMFWFRRRHEPLRALRRLANPPDPVAAANALAALIRRCNVDPSPDWLHELERLRFGPPSADAGDRISRLCREAESLLQKR